MEKTIKIDGNFNGAGGAREDNAANRLRWKQLILGVICMVMIANLQYGWTLFVLPLHNAHGWAVADIQFSFALFIALETWVTPLDGWIADSLGPKWGPRIVMGVGGILIAVGWIIDGQATSLPMLYLGGSVTGFGAGAVYTTAVGNATKWFKDRRGLAVGLTAAGFGAGAALTIIPIRMVLATSGVAATFLWFGLIQGVVILIVSQFIRAPYPGEAPVVTQVKVKQSTHSSTTGEMLRTPVFWVLYLLFLLMAAGGLMAAANLAAIAKSYGVADVTVLLGATALSVGLIFANIMNGVARPFFGWVSDQIGHSTTMAIAFGLGACAYFLMTVLGHNPWGFIFLAGVIFLCWGEIFSLFPAMCTDLFGPKYATTNLSCLYTSKGVAGFLVPVASLVVARTHDWSSALILTTAINLVAVVLVLLVLRPAEIRFHQREEELTPIGKAAE
ncbi:MAG TPA: oxalate/formate MFS antiporter [Tepidisphaeraceae bacterium]|jgi:OFA family oxalate/formate antiporter-like MFS transporter